MKGKETDRQVWDFFEALRDVEAAEAPPFDDLLTEVRSLPSGKSAWIRRGRLAWAAGIVLASLVFWNVLFSPGEPVGSESFAWELYSWEAPSDFLLASDIESPAGTLPQWDLGGLNWETEADQEAWQ
jgi:hypothetical protein